MKLKLFLAFAFAVSAASCESTDKKTTTTNDADTAVLVNDPANTMNANPVNDTTIADTVHTK